MANITAVTESEFIDNIFSHIGKFFVVFMLCILPTILVLVSWLITSIFLRKSSDKRLWWTSKFSTGIFLLLLFSVVSFIYGNNIGQKRSDVEIDIAKKKAALIIDKLNDYYEENRTYPSTLEEIGIKKEFII